MKTTQVLILQLLLVPFSIGSNMYLPLDCADIHNYDSTKPSGVYSIFPGGPISPLQVYCDMTEGGGWTVFQKRMDGSVNFYRPWNHYKKGFGDLTGEYWPGLDNIALLSLRKRNVLRVDMEDWEGRKVHAYYSSISVDPEQFDYTLHLGAFRSGSAGDSLETHNGMKFSTFDKDQDTSEKNCARSYMGGFWYADCYKANPNGLYVPDSTSPYEPMYVSWDTWKSSYSLKTITMKMRSLSQCED